MRSGRLANAQQSRSQGVEYQLPAPSQIANGIKPDCSQIPDGIELDSKDNVLKVFGLPCSAAILVKTKLLVTAALVSLPQNRNWFQQIEVESHSYFGHRQT